MSEATLEKAVCGKCGVDVRENTLFCYNCGGRVAEDPVEHAVGVNGSDADVDHETQAALDDLAERFKIDEAADRKMAKAAAERRKARVSQRKPRAFVWEPQDESSSNFVLILAVLVAVFAAIVVFLSVFLK